ncbi:MAG: protein kinase [Verrucomicrobiota bacterium]|jgi:WD40 repeat protein/serine/threonine protein kinase
MKDESANPNAGEAETIFNAALAFSAAERAAYLAGACRDNLALRQRVEALLRAHEAPPGFLPEESPPARPTVNVDGADSAPDDAVGMMVGRYKLLEKVGEGGCGVVYVAEQAAPVRRRVALKVIKLGMDTKAVVARFEAERQALAMMDHPNIAKVFDAGTTETGRPFFVMELVRGIKITEYCDQANLSTKERLDLFIKICQAIQHAHQKGIIHRDIKPSNIMVTLHDGVPVPKVIDFGIAKATEGRLTDATVYTQLHQFIGTPAYMSPEQAEMSGLDIDTRSDIYSLGVLLYELLAGSTPFDAKELMASGLDAMRKTIREKEPVRPSTRLATLKGEELTTAARRRSSDAPKLIHLLKGDLDWIVMKCLEKDRTHRYETANGLAMDLKRHLDNEPVVARPPSNLYRFQKLVRRNKLAVGAVAAVAVSLILGLGISSFLFIREKAARASEATMFVREKDARRQAEDAKKQAQADAARAEAASLELKTTLSASEFVQGSRLLSEGYGSDGLAYLARSLSDNPTNEAASTRLASLLASHYWVASAGSLQPPNAPPSGPDGKQPATASADGPVREWDAQSGQPLTETLKLGGSFTSAQFSPDGKRIVTVSGDGAHNTAQLWDAQTGQPLTGPLRDGNKLNSAQFSPDGKQIVTASADKTARVWDAQSGQPLTEPLEHDGAVMSAQFSPDGKRIVTVCSSNTARVWDAQSGRLTQSLKHDSKVNSAQFSPDGKRIVTVSDLAVRVWDAQSGQPLTEPLLPGGQATSAQFSPDGKQILTVSGEHRIFAARRWDAQSGRPLTEPFLYGTNVTSAQFSPDGKRIFTASFMTESSAGNFGGSARVWDAQTGKLLASPVHSDFGFFGMQFSRDGKRILTSAIDFARLMGAAAETAAGGTAPNRFSIRFLTQVWDAQSGQPLTDPLRQEGNDSLYSVSSQAMPISALFSPDGRRILTWSYDGIARIWDVAPPAENHPAWLPQLAEVISGQALNRQGVLEPTPLNRVEIINRLRQELSHEPDQDDWVVWGRWFLADPFTRTISPFSRQTVPDYVQNRIKENTAESLEQAERLVDGGDPLLQRIAEARKILAEKEAQTDAQKEASLFVATNAVDVVNPGEEQSETNHGFHDVKTQTGSFQKHEFRAALLGGWFSYEVKVLPDKPMVVVCTYPGDFKFPGNFDLLVNGQKIATETLQPAPLLDKPAQFRSKEYRIPEEMTQGLEHVTLKFRPRPRGLTTRIFCVRILTAENNPAPH